MATLLNSFFRGFPLAISWLVIASISISAYDSSWRSEAHVGQEIIEFQPTLTDANAAATIPLVIAFGGVETALFHCPPTLIGRCEPTILRMSVSNMHGPDILNLEASTAFCMPTGEIGSPDFTAIPAFTFTQPERFTISGTSSLDDRESIKLFATEMKRFRHIEIVSEYGVGG